MGEDNSPEIPIPMPEPPLPGSEAPLVAYFPFGVVDFMILGLIDFFIEAKFWSDHPTEQVGLWTYFPWGAGAQLIISVVDIIFSIVQGK
jgi:hypothetical protein